MDSQYTGKKILESRKSRGETQKDIAEAMNVSVAAVSKWERGLNFPDISLLEPLAQHLDISVSELLGLENESADKIISNMAQISAIEKENNSKTVKGNIVALFSAIAVFVLLSCGIYFLRNNDNVVEILFGYRNAGIFNLSALLLGVVAWGSGIAAILSEGKGRIFSFISFVCCAVAMYIPVLIIDSAMRSGGCGTVEDLSFAYNFASVVLLIGTVIFNAFAHFRKK